MIIDENLSETVSLSKVLDVLIDNEEHNDNVILSFLQEHESDFKEIIEESLNWSRIFQLDFILKCSEQNQCWLLSKLKSIPAKYSAFACWQICKLESSIANSIKCKFRQEFNWILNMFNTRHPYSTRVGLTASNYDCVLFDACKKDMFAEEIDRWKIEEFKRFLNVSSYSLFKYRFYQYDVFSKLDVIKQYLILQKLQDDTSTPLADVDFFQTFLLQLFSSDECPELKFEVLKAYVNYEKWQFQHIYRYAYDKEQLTLVDECEGSYAKLKIRMMLNGIIDNTQTILELFFKHKKDILISWLEDDPKSLDDNIRVSQLVQYIKNKKLFNEY